MFTMQRQGKMSFYMKSTGEEAVSVGHALALQDTDMIFPTYRQQGILINRGASMKDMMCQCLSNSGDPLDGKSIPVLYSFKKHGSKYRPENEPDVWPFGDPLERLKAHLILIGEWDEERHEALLDDCKEQVRETYKAAEVMGNLSGETKVNDFTMFEQVYEKALPHLDEQKRMFATEIDNRQD